MATKTSPQKPGICRKAAKALFFMGRYWWLAALVAVAVAAIALLRSCDEGAGVAIERQKSIDVTPEEIRAIRDIGQWEFLSVTTEELAELNEPGTFGDRQLVRIYQGRLSIGVDLHKAADNWFTAQGDTAFLQLPDVGLLDENFIDEARTRSFYEKGHMDAAARKKLYAQARQAMLRRHLTPQNLDAARKNAEAQFRKIFQAFGFSVVEISFTPQPARK